MAPDPFDFAAERLEYHAGFNFCYQEMKRRES